MNFSARGLAAMLLTGALLYAVADARGATWKATLVGDWSICILLERELGAGFH